MKKLLLVFLLCFSMCATCLAERYTIDTNRWMFLTNHKTGKHYQDIKSVEADRFLKTVSTWFLDYNEPENRAYLFNIVYNYNSRTYSIKNTIVRQISDGQITFSDTPSYAPEQPIVPDTLYEQLYGINKQFIEESKPEQYTYEPIDSKMVINLPLGYNFPLTKEFIEKNSEYNSFSGYKEAFNIIRTKVLAAL